MKICFYLNSFIGRGAEKMTVALANEMSRQGHDVTILVQYSGGSAKDFLRSGVSVIDMRLPARGKLRKNLCIIRQLREALRPERYDVLVSVCMDRSQLAALSTFFLKDRIPLISAVHSVLSQETYSVARTFLFPVLNKRYDRVIAVSDGVRRDYIRVCHAAFHQTVTVYNPVIDSGFEERAREALTHPWLDEKREFVTLVQAGEFSAEKNHRLMLRALRILNQKGDDYRLILLGDGKLRTELEQEAKQLGLEGKTDFAGYVANPLPYFKNADVVVLSSDYEGLPTVLIEALACGGRIVSTDCPFGPREILNDESLGILVECGNPQLLAEGIRKARSWEPDRERMRARARDFAADIAADRYLRVFHDVLRQNQRKALPHGSR